MKPIAKLLYLMKYIVYVPNLKHMNSGIDYYNKSYVMVKVERVCKTHKVNLQ